MHHVPKLNCCDFVEEIAKRMFFSYFIFCGDIRSMSWGLTVASWDRSDQRQGPTSKIFKYNWLVVDPPLWKIWKPVGIMTFPTEWKVNPSIPWFQTTNQPEKTPFITIKSQYLPVKGLSKPLYSNISHPSSGERRIQPQWIQLKKTRLSKKHEDNASYVCKEDPK